MYTYILRKEPSVGFGEGEKVVEVVMVKPCIPSTQGRGGGGGLWWRNRRGCGVHVVVQAGGAKGTPGVHLFLGGWAVRGGVTGRPELTPLYWYLAFFSEGFRIYRTKIDHGVRRPSVG